MSSIEDRLAIQDLLARYADVVDRRDFDGLDNVFTTDARIDFSAFGGPLCEVKPRYSGCIGRNMPSARSQRGFRIVSSRRG